MNTRGFTRVIQCGLVAGAWVLGVGAQAATASGTFDVTATVLESCAVSAANLAFGNYSSSQKDATTSISVSCTNLTVYTVEISAGGGSGATTATRRMTGPSSATLDYSLYQDASRLVVWGTLADLQAVAGVGNGAAQTLTVYGRIPGSQYPAAGAYTDTVTVTVNY